jgi:SAM-dependent methyltransferase
VEKNRLEERSATIQTYIQSGNQLAEYYDSLGPRIDDIDRAIELWGDRLPVVVEVGCGCGRDAAEILKRTPYYMGIDISPSMLDRAKANSTGGAFILGDLRYAFPGNTSYVNGDVVPDRVDIVFSFASMLHSNEEEVQGVLSDALNVLTPGGIFYISLKLGEGKTVKEDRYGERTFYLYTPEKIQELAGERYETAYVDTQHREDTDWFTIALRKTS